MKIRQKWEPSCSLRTDGRMHGNEANSHFSPFCERAYKTVSSGINLSHKIGYTNKTTLKHYVATLINILLTMSILIH